MRHVSVKTQLDSWVRAHSAALVCCRLPAVHTIAQPTVSTVLRSQGPVHTYARPVSQDRNRLNTVHLSIFITAVPRAVHTFARPTSGTGRLRLPFLPALIVPPRVVVVCPQALGLGLHLLVLCPPLHFTLAPFIAIISSSPARFSGASWTGRRQAGGTA